MKKNGLLMRIRLTFLKNLKYQMTLLLLVLFTTILIPRITMLNFKTQKGPDQFIEIVKNYKIVQK